MLYVQKIFAFNYYKVGHPTQASMVLHANQMTVFYRIERYSVTGFEGRLFCFELSLNGKTRKD
jgi:hypothetical protein